MLLIFAQAALPCRGSGVRKWRLTQCAWLVPAPPAPATPPQTPETIASAAATTAAIIVQVATTTANIQCQGSTDPSCVSKAVAAETAVLAASTSNPVATTTAITNLNNASPA